jgi:putative transposase
VTLATTLLDADVYSAGDLAEAYGLRWTIETSFNHLKTTMKMDVLRCQTVKGVTKELTMFLLVYNLVRMTILEAARRQEASPERISFVDALVGHGPTRRRVARIDRESASSRPL